MQLGTSVDGRALTYDARLYEFRLARELVTLEQLRDLDNNAHIRWRASEQRDWFRNIKASDLDACNKRALARLGMSSYAGMTPEERVQADAARDDSVLAGKIVDADPVLVQAVAAKLEEQGLLSGIAAVPATANPLAMANLPKGMEALSQMERHHGADRKMTAAEKRLMKKILKNDDKEKARREKAESKAEKHAGGESVKSGDAKRAKDKGAASEKGMARESAATPQARITSDAIDVVASSSQHHRFPEIHYTDSQGNPLAPSASAVRPDMEQLADGLSEEARALNEMRERNRAADAQLAVTDVPGMEKASRSRRSFVSRINGIAVNPDGSPKDTRFKDFLKGLGEVVDVVAPLAGGGRGGGSGGGGVPGEGSGGGSGGGPGGGGFGAGGGR